MEIMKLSDIEAMFVQRARDYLRERYEPNDPNSLNPDGLVTVRLLEAVAAGIVSLADAKLPR